jgi:DNA polymerase-1
MSVSHKKCVILWSQISFATSVMEQKKLFLLDAYALIYRAYYALVRSPRVTSKGMNTSAIFGFVNTLEEILRKENPTHIAVCFDPRGGTFRHEAYAEYKANRQKQPEDITLAIPYIKRLLDAYRIPAVEVAGYEADDVIGTLSCMADKEGFTTYMVTPDKDYGQLVNDRVFMYSPMSKGAGFEVRGSQEVCAKFGLQRTEQVIDYLALQGDASDNVPGCPGVGEKTAVKLLSQYETVEGIIDHVAEIKGALGEKVAANIEQIKFSKFLVTIKTDVPLDVTPDSFARKEPDSAALLELFKELEFRSFASKLTASMPAQTDVPPTPAKPVEAKKVEKPMPDDGMGSLFDMLDEPQADTPADAFADIIADYNYLTNTEDVTAFLRTLGELQRIGFALNVEGDESMTAELKGMAIASAPGKAVYFTMPILADDRDEVLGLLRTVLTSATATIVSHDIKRDIIVFRRLGIELTAKYYDTAIAHYLLSPETSHALSLVAMTQLGYQMQDYELTDKERKALRLSDPDVATRYLCEAADIELRLVDVLDKHLAQDGLDKLFNDVELPFAAVLAAMEWEGVCIDTAELAAQSRKLSARLDGLLQEAYRLAGHEFNLSSPKQVGDVLFGEMAIDPKVKKTKSGSWSTTEEVLEKYSKDQPIVGLILEYRGLKKLINTYLDALPKLINPKTGKIHTTFNQTVTATGRISSTNPNLQNIPIRTDEGREIRRAFVPEAGALMLSADYSQIELRLMADISGDPDMVAAFQSGADIHRATAAKIYGVPLEEVTDEQRRAAKTANFGIIYGISAFGLAERLSISRSEAKSLIDGYFQTYPRISGYISETIDRARDNGYVKTVMGRKRYLPDINSQNHTVRGYAERNAVNAPLQGSAADIIKVAMVNIYREMRQRNLASRMIIQVHDELIFNVVPAEADVLKELVVRNMENAYHGRVPLTVAAAVASNWLEAH